jgi:nucleoside-diphosphate kinase
VSQLERTLAIIKPDSVARGIAGEILSTIEQAGFRIRGMRMLHLDRPQAEGFYAVHRGKPFFPDLVEFMTEGPLVVLALER